MTFSSSNKKVNFLAGRVTILSAMPMHQIASLVAARLVPGGGDLEWNDLDGHETPVLGLKGVLGGALEIQNVAPMDFTLSYDTDVRFVDDQSDALGIQVGDEDYVVITPLLLWALGDIPGLSISAVDIGSGR